MNNNPAGRPIGSKNKSTTELRELVQSLFEDRYEDFIEALDLLDPKEKVDAYFKLMGFVLPKQKDFEVGVKEIAREQPFFELPDIDCKFN